MRDEADAVGRRVDLRERHEGVLDLVEAREATPAAQLLGVEEQHRRTATLEQRRECACKVGGLAQLLHVACELANSRRQQLLL